MRPVSCLSFLAAIGLSLGGCADTPSPPSATSEIPTFYAQLDAANASVDPVAARDMLSVYRRNHGLPTLTIDPGLQEEARAMVAAMARANSIAPGKTGSLPARLAARGMSRTVAVENLSAGYHTLAEAFSGWRESRPHDLVMLDPRARHMGIATAYAPGAKYKVFWALILTE